MVRLTSLPAFAVAATVAQAADFGPYVDPHVGGTHSNSEVGGYQQLMDQFAADQARGTGTATIFAASEGATAAGRKANSESHAKTDGPATPRGFDYSKFLKGGGQSRGQSSGQGGPGGDWEQYMSKYMKDGSSGKNGSAGGQGAGYQQYMGQYGDYSKYMGPSGGKSGSGPSGGSPSGGNPGGNYMRQYAGGFTSGAAGAKAGASATSLVSTKSVGPKAKGGGSQQYMTKYAGPYMGGASSGAGYQQFMEKYAGDYAGQYTGSSHQKGPAATSLLATGSSDVSLKVKTQGANSSVASGAGAGYQQYMDKYAASYTGGGQGGQGGWEHFMSDYASQYAGQYMGSGANASSLAAMPSGSGGGAGGYQQYVSAYTGSGNGQTMAQNQQAMNALPYAAADCKTLAQLEAWKASKTQQMTHFIPAAYRAQPLQDVEKDYRTAKAKLEANAAETQKDLQAEEPAKTSLDSTGAKAQVVEEEMPAKESLDSTGAQAQGVEEEKPTKESLDSTGAQAQVVEDDKSVEQQPATDVEDTDSEVADAEGAVAEGAAKPEGSNEGATAQLAEIPQGVEGRHVNLIVVGLVAVAVGWIGLVAFRRQRALASMSNPLLQSEVDDNQYVPLCLQA